MAGGPKNRTVRARIIADDQATATLRRVQNAFGAAGAVISAFGLYALGRDLVRGAKAAIDASSESEKSIAGLANAIRNSGQDVATTLPKYLALAQSLQRQTAVSDEAIASGEAMLITLGRLSDEGLERATKASLDLAASGVDVDTAFRLVARAAAGNTTALARLGIVVDNTGTKAEVLDRTLASLENKFGGRAAAMFDTYEGQVKNVALAWDDLLESVGASITQSPAVRAALEGIAEAIRSITDAFSGPQGIALIKDAVLTLADIAIVGERAGLLLAFMGGVAKSATYDIVALATGNREAMASTYAYMLAVTEWGSNFESQLMGIRNAVARTGTTAVDAAHTSVDPFTDSIDEAGKAIGDFKDIITTGPEWPFAKRLEELGVPLHNTKVETTEVSIALQELFEAAANGLPQVDFKRILAELTEIARTLTKEGGVVPGFEALTITAQESLTTMDEALLMIITDLDAFKAKVADGSVQVMTLGETITDALGHWAVSAVGRLSNALAQAATGGEVMWGDFLRDLVASLIAAVAQALILKAILAAVGASSVGGGLINITLFSFAKGGIMPGGAAHGRIVPGMDTGRDSVLSAVRPGEAILPPELTNFLLNAATRRTSGDDITIEVHGDLPLLVRRINDRVDRGNVRLRATELVGTRTSR